MVSSVLLQIVRVFVCLLVSVYSTQHCNNRVGFDIQPTKPKPKPKPTQGLPVLREAVSVVSVVSVVSLVLCQNREFTSVFTITVLVRAYFSSILSS